MIKAILFDKDGTLLDFDATWIPAISYLVEEIAGGDEVLGAKLANAGGYDRQAGTIEPGSLFASGNAATLAVGWHPLLNSAANRQSKPCMSCAELGQKIEDIFTTQSAHHITALFDVAALFGRLKHNQLSLGIASSDSHMGVEAAAEALEIGQLTDFICGYDSGFGRKPEPGMVNGFCGAVGIAPCDTLVIGDNIHDLEMGKRAGAGLLVGVLSGNSAATDLAPLADEILQTAEDLPALLSRLAAV